MKFMSRFIKLTVALLLLAGTAGPARAFSLLGNYDTWQTAALGYQLASDIGGPVNITEGYRWNVPVITYGFDSSFLNYFGQRGVDEVEKAIAILNNLPAASMMSSNLSEYPLDARRINHQAAALGIMDVKSHTLEKLVELLGLGEPERYIWTLRERQTRTIGNVTTTNYLVIQRNFDPITWAQTKLVNGATYTYRVEEPLVPGDYADAIEYATDQLALAYTAVASGMAGSGSFYTGLTRDDVGGLRYLYRHNNYAVENLSPDASNAVGQVTSGYYQIYWPTNATLGTNYWTGNTTNGPLVTGLRPGVDKVSFQRVDYDSFLGQTLVPYYYDYTDIVITNNTEVSQPTRRYITTVPDILFRAGDLGVIGGGSVVPVQSRRAITFTSNDAINGNMPQAGPGVLQTATIDFSFLLPGYINDDTDPFYDPTGSNRTSIWGAFDGTTNAPVIFPNSISIQDIERQVMGN